MQDQTGTPSCIVNMQESRESKPNQDSANKATHFKLADFEQRPTGIRAEWLAPDMYIDVYCHELNIWHAGIVEAVI